MFQPPSDPQRRTAGLVVREERGNERKNQPATFSWKPSSAIRFPPAVSPSICPVWGGSMTLCHLSQLSGVPELLGPERPACVALRVDCGLHNVEQIRVGGRGTAYLTPLFCLPVTSRCLTQEAKVMKDVCTRTEALVRSNLPVLASLTGH